ncbi:SHOCT domain-containing protein [Actinocrinis sp.]|uniref:SHOCT domain-containing protein n=1 Tax=Actinocrinis sp. TaxID=1920516 RepID=UPI002CD0FBD5|nr:SHOCT domain-containing protein [Actinocrinis sp.]HXR74014.1 SHOCT domain-containing protein [Actinocrinis sp.]
MGRTGAVVILVVIVLVLGIWAARGDKVKSAAQQRREAEAAERRRLGITDADYNLSKRARGFGLLLDTLADTIRTAGQSGGRFTGSLASVETEGQLTSRITVTRLATLGVFALGARKKVDNRELYITVEGDGFQLVAKLPPTSGALARQFAAAYNTRSGAMAAKPAAGGIDGVAVELERLAKLHADGALDQSEFNAAKARLLGTTPQPEPEDQRP